MANSQVILQPTTAAAFSDEFSPIINNTTTIMCAGLQGSETVILQIKDPIAGWVDCPDDKISATTNPYLTGFFECGTFRVKKPITATAIGISIVQNVNTSTIKLGLV